MSETELRKCPFCGGEAKFVVISKSDSLCDIGYCFTIQCSKCYIKLPREYRVDFKLSDRGSVTTTLDERKIAVNAWNRRIFDKEKVIEELDKLTGEECTLHECGIRSERCKPCIAKKAIEIVEKGEIE